MVTYWQKLLFPLIFEFNFKFCKFDFLTIFSWDQKEIDRLPDYMRTCYMALLDLSHDIEEELGSQEKSYAIQHYNEKVRTIYVPNNLMMDLDYNFKLLLLKK